MRDLSKRHLILIALLLLGSGALFLGKKKRPASADSLQRAPVTSPQSAAQPADSDSTGASSAKGKDEGADAAAKEREARRSLDVMSRLLSKAFAPDATMDQVFRELKATGQKPFITRSGSSATGSLRIMRTKSPLPGTRYFHAQYFTDEQGKVFPQHMSFEFRPGPHSLQEAAQAAAKNFRLGKPSERKADFIQWDLDDDYVLWIKKKSAADLQDDPFNAYDPVKDAGTTQMAVEMKIHGDSDEGHEH